MRKQFDLIRSWSWGKHTPFTSFVGVEEISPVTVCCVAHQLFTWLSPVRGLLYTGHGGRRDFVSVTITFELWVPFALPHQLTSLAVVVCLFVSKFLGWLDDPVQSRIAIKGNTEKYLKENYVGKLAFIRLMFMGLFTQSLRVPLWAPYIKKVKVLSTFWLFFSLGYSQSFRDLKFGHVFLYFSKLALNNKIVERILYRPVALNRAQTNKRERNRIESYYRLTHTHTHAE